MLAPSGGISLDDPSISPDVHTKRFGPDGPTGRRPRLAFHAEGPTDSGAAECCSLERHQTSAAKKVLAPARRSPPSKPAATTATTRRSTGHAPAAPVAASHAASGHAGNGHSAKLHAGKVHPAKIPAAGRSSGQESRGRPASSQERTCCSGPQADQSRGCSSTCNRSNRSWNSRRIWRSAPTARLPVRRAIELWCWCAMLFGCTPFGN